MTIAKTLGQTVGVMLFTGVVLLTVPGCLDRTERIIVNEDGSVDIQAIFQGQESADFDNEDRLPRPGGSWQIKESSEVNAEGKTVYTRVATRHLPGGAELPATFGERNDRDEDAYLQFPTTLRIENRSDGTYYHFARVYQARDYAQTGFLQETAETELKKFTDDRPPGQPLGRTEWRTISEQMVKVEIQKYQVWARNAFNETQPYAPQDAWLGVVTALDQFRRTIDYDTIASIIEQNVDAGENAKDNVFDELARELDRSTLQTIFDGMSSSPNVVNTSAFKERLAFHQKAWKVTQDLDDEKFTIRVQMPGQIVGHNGDNRMGNVITWNFGGEFLHDRTIELLVTSKVAN